MTATKEKIFESLKRVRDPELARDIVTLGMVKEVGVDAGNVFIHLEVTSPKSEVREKIRNEVKSCVASLEGVGDVTVQVSSPTRQGPAFSPKGAIPGVRHVIAVASGKGGVGKTTVAVNLALALARQGQKIGLMDADIYGPNVPLMLGVPAGTRPHATEDERIVPLVIQGLKMISMGVLIPPDQPMIWRGPMLHSAVTQFLQKVDWGELDFLLIDLPPGTGDVQLSLVQTAPLAGAVIVTTPQEVALMDVRKGIAMFRKTNVPILGVIENMTGEIFGKGGGERTASELQVPYLGEIPLDRRIREGGDSGRPVVAADPESAVAQAFFRAADTIINVMQTADAPGASKQGKG